MTRIMHATFLYRAALDELDQATPLPLE